jgi:L-amino acid N-acyltransferase YncA
MTKVRPVEISDLDDIYQIYRPFIENSAVSFELEMPGKDAFLERILSISKKFPYYVLEDNGKIRGYAYATTHREREAYKWCVETSIYMAESSRGMGLGKILYDCLITELTDRKFTLAYGIITQPNEASTALHLKCGFEKMALHRNAGYKLGKWHDVLWMERNLAACSIPAIEPIFSS